MNQQPKQRKALALAIGLALTAPLAQADHNSIWGEGWATDAQGKHAEAVDRIEELGLGTDDNQAGARTIKVQGTPRERGEQTEPADRLDDAASRAATAASGPLTTAGQTEPETPDSARRSREQLRQAETEDEDGGERLRHAERLEYRYGTGYEYRMQRPERGLRPERPDRPDRPQMSERPQRPEPAERPQRPQGPERMRAP